VSAFFLGSLGSRLLELGFYPSPKVLARSLILQIPNNVLSPVFPFVNGWCPLSPCVGFIDPIPVGTYFPFQFSALCCILSLIISFDFCPSDYGRSLYLFSSFLRVVVLSSAFWSAKTPHWHYPPISRSLHFPAQMLGLSPEVRVSVYVFPLQLGFLRYSPWGYK